MNTTLFRSWAYAESMPTLELGGFKIGVMPRSAGTAAPRALYLGLAKSFRSARVRYCTRKTG
ncbi:MAG TPA: hypothetical protein VFZ74_13900 [Burkholderiales bacterium]